MKKLLSLLLIICSIGVAYADDKSTVTSLKYVTDELNTRQDKFGANDGKAMTFTNAAGGNLPRDVKENLGTSTTDSGLPTVSAVNTGLENKQDEIGAANTNTVVTYTGTPGTLGQKGIYQDTGTYATQSDNLIQASTFNAALRNGLENEFVCAGTDDGTANGNCWLWTIDNATENRTKNLFDISKVSTVFYADESSIVNNGNGSITVTTSSTNSAFNTRKKLSYFAPDLQVGHTYTLSFKRTGTNGENYIYLHGYNGGWRNRSALTITQEMLDSNVYFYANGAGTTGTIWDIQIEEGTIATPYEPYNLYIPQNQSAQNQ